MGYLFVFIAIIYIGFILVQFDQIKLENNSKYLYWLIGLLAVTCIISVILLFLGSIGNLFAVEQETDPRAALGTLGDYFGGMLNPILGFLSFIALLVTLHFQSKQLKHTETQLKQNEIALRDTRQAIKQNETALKQNAEALKVNNAELANSNHQLVLSSSAHQEMVKAQRYQQVDNLFFTLLDHFTLKIERVSSDNERLENTYKNIFYIHNIRGMVERKNVIDSHIELKILFDYLNEFLINLMFSAKKNSIDYNYMKIRYVNLIKNIIPNKLKYLLFARCAIEEYDSTYIEYKRILEELEFFDNLILYGGNILLTSKILYFSTCYDSKAFGENKKFKDFKESIFYSYFSTEHTLSDLFLSSVESNLKVEYEDGFKIAFSEYFIYLKCKRVEEFDITWFEEVWIEESPVRDFDFSRKNLFCSTDNGTYIIDFKKDENRNIKYIG